MLAWGVVMTLMGLVESYPGLVVTRQFLGFTEVSRFPKTSEKMLRQY